MMKIQDFICKKCNNIFEELVSPNEKVSCIRCNSKKVEAILNGPKLIEVKNSTAPGSKLSKKN